MSFWYISTPYSKYPHGLDAAFMLAVHTRGLLLRADVPCFSPIIHSHIVAKECGIDPLDHSVWLPAEEPIMHAARRGIILVKAESWELSYGMAEEKKFFERCGRPVIFMDPGVVPEELR